MESIASPRLEKKNQNEVKEAGWTPGNFETLEDVPGWEKQLAYFDIAQAEIDMFIATDLRFSPEDLIVAEEAVKKFNEWMKERIAPLETIEKKEIESKFGYQPAKIIMNENTESNSPFKIVFSYVPNPSDYKDIFEYEERAPESERGSEGQDSLDDVSSAEHGLLKKPIDSKWWPKGLLPRGNKVEE